jgi:MFS transporter, AAHS family, 4-hydroxybenzoate transporter
MSTSASISVPQSELLRRPLTVVLLGALVLLLDGFDTQSISYAAPLIARQMQLPHSALGPIFSSAVVGLMLGYLLLAPLADRFGSKRVIILSTAAFGVFSLATVWANSEVSLIVLRCLTGIGLGAAAPAVISLTDDHSPRHLRATFVLAIYRGFSLGFIAAGFAASQLLAVYGWTSLFWSGALLPLPLCPALLVLPPATVRVPGARTRAKVQVAELFRSGYARGTPLLWAIFPSILLRSTCSRVGCRHC